MLLMRAMRFHSSLPAAGAALALISLPLIGQDNRLLVAGTVTDPTQEPLAKAIVTLSSNDRVLQTQTSARGQFRFESVPRGAYDLECKAHGFRRLKVSVDLSGADAPPLAIVLEVGPMPDLEECGPHPSIAYSLVDPKRPQVAGVVRNYENRKPLPRARLVLTRVDDSRIHSRTVATDEGSFGFEKLTPGRYELRISRHGYFPAEVKQLLVPNENSVTVDIPMKRDDQKLIVCQ